MQELRGHEVVEIFTAATSGIVKYGLAIEYRDLDAPRTGIFDGLRIVVDPDVGFEMQCFLLPHLFGHSAQWVAPSLAHKLDALQHTDDRARFMQVLQDYKFEAAGFGLQLLHERGITAQDQGYSDFVHTDWRYVERYYETVLRRPRTLRGGRWRGSQGRADTVRFDAAGDTPECVMP